MKLIERILAFFMKLIGYGVDQEVEAERRPPEPNREDEG